MPRPTVAQLAYGSCTVIFSTLAMLLLSQASSAPAIAVITVAALALGLLVAMTVQRPKPASKATKPLTRAEQAPERERLAA
jgi:flagellar biosynthesis component FlhA